MLDSSDIEEVNLVGSVNDLSVHPATMHNVVYLYVNFETLERWGLKPNKIEYVVSEGMYDRENILQKSNEFIHLLESKGYTVKSLNVDETPGESMHMSEYEGAMFLMQIFSIVSLVFGCMIMSNLISSLLSKQIRQIGVMKAIGGSNKKILSAYLLAILLVVLLALGISTILVVLVSGNLAEFLLSIGNMIPKTTMVPTHIFAIFLGCIFIAPMIIAAFPVFKGLRITVKEAFHDYGISYKENKKASLKVNFLSRPVMLSLRNAFRRKGRFILNVTILVFAGSMFMAVLSNMISVQNAIDKSIGMFQYDYEMTIGGYVEEKKISDILLNMDKVSDYEIWLSTTVSHLYRDGQTGNTYSVIAPASQSKMIDPVLVSGRWIEEQDKDQIVVTEKFMDNESQYSVGDTIEFRVGGNAHAFEIVGVMKAIGASQKQIIRVITTESIFISLSSCIGAALLGGIITIISIPIFGSIINVPLSLRAATVFVSISGWIILSFFVGYMASRKVAKRTSGMRTKEIFSLD